MATACLEGSVSLPSPPALGPMPIVAPMRMDAQVAPASWRSMTHATISSTGTPSTIPTTTITSSSSSSSYLPLSPPDVERGAEEGDGDAMPLPAPPPAHHLPDAMRVNVVQDAPTFLALAFMEIYYQSLPPPPAASSTARMEHAPAPSPSLRQLPFWHPASPLHARWRILHPWCRHIVSCCPPSTLSLHTLELALLYARKFKRCSAAAPALAALSPTAAAGTGSGGHPAAGAPAVAPSDVKTDVLLLVTCLLLAVKATHDTRSRPLQNAFWAEACGFPLPLLNRVERSFLRMCRYDMWVQPVEYAEFRGFLSTFYS